jgi:hypothetical protein
MQLAPPAVVAKGQVYTLILNTKIFILNLLGPLKDSHRGRRFEHDDELKHRVSEEFRRFCIGL